MKLSSATSWATMEDGGHLWERRRLTSYTPRRRCRHLAVSGLCLGRFTAVTRKWGEHEAGHVDWLPGLAWALLGLVKQTWDPYKQLETISRIFWLSSRYLLNSYLRVVVTIWTRYWCTYLLTMLTWCQHCCWLHWQDVHVVVDCIDTMFAMSAQSLTKETIE